MTDLPKYRLNKYLALCGLGSRRHCDELIADGKIQVNGSTCTKPATQVTIEDYVKIEGKRVLPMNTAAYVMNKPKGYLCTKSDEHDRDTIYALLSPKLQHLNHVGRLDQNSEGLLILTNDGALSQQLTHPTKKVEKEYLVTTNRAFDNETLNKLLKGIYIDKKLAKAKAIKRISPRRLLIILDTGLKRQIRMMFQALNFRVTKLIRIRIGCYSAPELPLGKIAELSPADLSLLSMNPPKLAKGYVDKPILQKRTVAKKKPRSRTTKPSKKSYKRRR